jgi:putative heme-binding domain-containing protein
VAGSLRLLLFACFLPLFAQAQEKPPITKGLELWFDAARIQGPVEGKGLPTWLDGAGLALDLRQAKESERPKLVKFGSKWVVRFDGVDDHLRAVGINKSLEGATVFLVAAPHSNLGSFSGFCAANARERRDYESGFNIDLGPFPTLQLQSINIEGPGFGGAHNLLNRATSFGQLQIFETVIDPVSKKVILTVDGKPTGQRAFTPSRIQMDEFTLGARFYTNGPGAQEVRGHWAGDFAEVLIYNRPLPEAEAKQVRDYLTAKHADLKKNLITPVVNQKLLKPIDNPPAVQFFVSGFQVRELPLDLSNINNIRYRPDGKLVALGYDGNIYLLSDTDGDGLEDKATLFWDNQGRLRSPIGMALTPPGYARGEGVFVACKGKCTLIVDTDKDGVADREIIVAEGWKELPHNVDALGVAVDPKDGSVYFGIGTTNFTNGYLIDKNGKAQYRLDNERGTILKVSPDFKKREIVCTGIRFPVAMGFSPKGDLFASDQEGATWLSNGNPFDELLHIQPGRHYGFPPKHPKHLPQVVDEPSVYDYGPQHQSTCGFTFNEPVNGGPVFGPASWRGDVLMCGYSRGKLYRTRLVSTPEGYLATNQLLACFRMLTVDACVSPKGDLVVACHGGGPDWGSGPSGKGKLYKVSYTGTDLPQPVAIWPAGPDEMRITFDRPFDPAQLKNLAEQATLTGGAYVRAGDEFESQRPGYDIVRMQMLAPRNDLKVRSVQFSPDRRTLILSTDQQRQAGYYALKLPGLGRPPLSKETKPGLPLPQVPRIDLDYSLAGITARFEGKGGNWSGWLPHLDPRISRELTASLSSHSDLWTRAEQGGRWKLQTQLDLSNMLHSAYQPGTKADEPLPPETITLMLASPTPFTVQTSTGKIASQPAGVGVGNQQVVNWQVTPKAKEWLPIEIYLTTDQTPSLQITWKTNEDSRPRPLALHRQLVPWAEPLTEGPPVKREVPELAGGSWARGYMVFTSNEAACSKCHSVNGQGSHIGPDLSNLVQRDYHSVLRDITEPSFAINPDHISYRIGLHNGRSLTGAVRTQGEQILIGDEKGNTVTVRRADVDTMTPSSKSIMPEGLPKLLGPEKLRDLMTYLLTEPPQMPSDYPGGPPPPPRSREEVQAVLAGAPEAPATKKPLHIALVAGRKDHGPGEHDYPAWLKAWKELFQLAEGVKVTTAMDWPSADDLKSADVLVFYQQGSWTPEKARDIDAFLNRGGGLVYLHYAVDGGKDAPGFAQRIGLAWGAKAKFRHGPLELGFETGDKHPIGRNFSKVKFVDESYWQLTGDPKKIRLLASGMEDGKPQPLFWTIEPEQGRVFVSILGHYSWTFDDPLFRILVLRGIAWTAREPVDRLNDLVWPGSRVK